MSMFGHTHAQYFDVTSGMSNPEKHIGFAQIGPSVTTNEWKNPAFAILEVDAETMLMTNV